MKGLLSFYCKIIALFNAFLLVSCLNFGGYINTDLGKLQDEQVRSVLVATLPERLRIVGPFDVILVDGNSIEVEMNVSLKNAIQVINRGSQVLIRPAKRLTLSGSGPKKIFVGISNLSGLDLQTTATVSSEKIWSASNINLQLDGLVSGKISLKTDVLNIINNSAGYLEFLGSANTLQLVVNDVAHMNFKKFDIKEKTIKKPSYGSRLSF